MARKCGEIVSKLYLCGKPATGEVWADDDGLRWVRTHCDEHYEKAATRMLKAYGTIYVRGLGNGNETRP